MEAESLEVSGERAVEWGNVRGALALGGGDSEPVNLTYLFVYRLDSNGQWRISHDISTPAAPAP
jgi:ketosteroid isomerase-like protein